MQYSFIHDYTVHIDVAKGHAQKSFKFDIYTLMVE